MAQLLGPDGQPIRFDPALMTREQATESVTGVPSTFDAMVTPTLMPARMASILRAAALGDMRDFLTLAEEMEEREAHYRYVLETRKNALTSLRPQVSPASESAADVRIADFLRAEVVETPGFAQIADKMADGLAKGYSIIELVWEMSATQWVPRQFIWRDPRLFQFDEATRSEFRLRYEGEREGRPLPPLKYITHVPLLKMGLPARNGLARVAAWAFMLKNFSLKDWAEFLDIYGMPFRVGKYPDGASVENKRVLANAIRSIGRDAAAMIPAGMVIEFHEPKGAAADPFDKNVRYLDEQLSRLIIGKGENAGSRAAEETLDKVRIDIARADSRDAALTLNEQLIRPIVDLNFGPQKNYPQLTFPIPERKDLQIWSNSVTQLVDRGFEVEQSQVYDVLGLKEPAPGAKLLRPGGGGAKNPPQTPVEKAAALGAARAAILRLDPRNCPGCGAKPFALRADDPTRDDDPDDVDELVALAIEDWEPDMAPVIEAITAAASRATSHASFRRELDRLAGALPTGPLAERLAVFGMIGRGRGDANE